MQLEERGLFDMDMKISKSFYLIVAPSGDISLPALFGTKERESGQVFGPFSQRYTLFGKLYAEAASYE